MQRYNLPNKLNVEQMNAMPLDYVFLPLSGLDFHHGSAELPRSDGGWLQ